MAHTPITQEISDLPTPPSSTDIDNFATRADAFVVAQDNMQPELNTLSDQMNVVANETNDNAQLADDKATEAEASAILAQGTANNKGAWSTLSGALNIPASVNHTGSVWVLNVNIADITASEPTAINTDWTEISGVTQAELDLKAPLVSPILTGSPTAPTPPTGDNSTKIATTAFVANEMIGSSPAKTVVSWSFITTTITLNITNHGLLVDDYFSVSGLVSTTLTPNGVYKVVSVPTVNSITYTATTAPTGTPTVLSALIYKSAPINHLVTLKNIKIVDFGTVFSNNRYVMPNPFGNTEVSTQVELFLSGRWSKAGYFVAVGTSPLNTAGATSGMILGEGIVVQTAFHYLSAGGASYDGNLANSSTAKTSAPCRVIVTYTGELSNA